MGKKRFSRYNFALKANDGSVATGSALDKYKKYATGETKLTYTRAEDSNPGSLVEVYVIPFLGAEDTNLYRTTMSARSDGQMAAILGANTLLNHKTPGAGDSKIKSSKFKAARFIIGTSGTGTSNETSKITGVTYKKETNAKSYSYPFGRDAAAISTANSITGVFEACKTAAKAKDTANENTYSLQPEIFRP